MADEKAHVKSGQTEVIIPVRLAELMNHGDTANTIKSLQALFNKIMSGEDYNKEQVKYATTAANTMVKFQRLHFDVYKHFAGRLAG